MSNVNRMNAQHERPLIHLVGDDDRKLHATWSRSGKRLIVSVYRDVNSPIQIELTESQVSELGQFLLESREDMLG